MFGNYVGSYYYQDTNVYENKNLYHDEAVAVVAYVAAAVVAVVMAVVESGPGNQRAALIQDLFSANVANHLRFGAPIT
jgi:hypothetical protein